MDTRYPEIDTKSLLTVSEYALAKIPKLALHDFCSTNKLVVDCSAKRGQLPVKKDYILAIQGYVRVSSHRSGDSIMLMQFLARNDACKMLKRQIKHRFLCWGSVGTITTGNQGRMRVHSWLKMKREFKAYNWLRIDLRMET
jgi:hypothetical protein